MECLVVLVFLTMIGHASACSCIGRTPAEKFCEADFAVLVKVIGRGVVIGNERRYTIDLIATFRSNAYGKVDEQFLYTATNSAACGITLEKKKYYILTGYYQNGNRMHTGLCDMQTKFTTNPLPVYIPPTCNGGTEHY